MSAAMRVSIPSPRSSPENLCAEPINPPEPPAGALALLNQARAGLRDAQRATRSSDRYVFGYLAALRAATAVITARAWRRAASRPASVWRLLPEVAPELAEWAEFFAEGSARRAAAESGVAVSVQVADRLLFHTGEFLEIVGRSLLEAPR